MSDFLSGLVPEQDLIFGRPVSVPPSKEGRKIGGIWSVSSSQVWAYWCTVKMSVPLVVQATVGSMLHLEPTSSGSPSTLQKSVSVSLQKQEGFLRHPPDNIIIVNTNFLFAETEKLCSIDLGRLGVPLFSYDDRRKTVVPFPPEASLRLNGVYDKRVPNPLRVRTVCDFCEEGNRILLSRFLEQNSLSTFLHYVSRFQSFTEGHTSRASSPRPTSKGRTLSVSVKGRRGQDLSRGTGDTESRRRTEVRRVWGLVSSSDLRCRF